MLIYNNASLFAGDTNANVTSKVISVKIQGIEDGQRLFNPVTFFFVNNANATNYSCAYWDFDSSSWQTDGCTEDLDASNGSYVACTCTHLVGRCSTIDVINTLFDIKILKPSFNAFLIFT